MQLWFSLFVLQLVMALPILPKSDLGKNRMTVFLNKKEGRESVIFISATPKSQLKEMYDTLIRDRYQHQSSR